MAIDWNLKRSNLDIKSEAEAQAERATESAGSGGKYFDPGNYDVKIVEAEHHKNKDTGSVMCKGDDTWLNVKLVLEGVDGRRINTWLQVPTQGVRFKTTKGTTLSMYEKFQKAMAAFGKPVTVDTLQDVVPKLFADPKKLVGLKANVDIGYEGSYVEFVKDDHPDGKYRVQQRKGSAYSVVMDGDDEVRFQDGKSARNWADGQNIRTSMVSVLKYNGGAPAPTNETKAEDDAW